MTTQFGVELPDGPTVLLPARAYLLSLKDQNLPLRRLALEDAEHYFAAVEGDDPHTTQLAVVGVIGEALQIAEDIAAFGHALVSDGTGLPFLVAASSYSTRSVNNFYSALHKQTDEYFRHLLGMRFGPIRIEEAFVINPPLTDADRAAIDEADSATIRLVREHLVRIAKDWERYRRFFHAFKHGLLVVNPHDGWLVEDRSQAIESIVVWRRRRPAAEGHGQIQPPFADTVAYVADVGRLGLDILGYLVESRLRFFDLIEFRDDGSVAPSGRAEPPWLWWFRNDAVSSAARERLAVRFGITFSG